MISRRNVLGLPVVVAAGLVAGVAKAEDVEPLLTIDGVPILIGINCEATDVNVTHRADWSNLRNGSVGPVEVTLEIELRGIRFAERFQEACVSSRTVHYTYGTRKSLDYRVMEVDTDARRRDGLWDCRLVLNGRGYLHADGWLRAGPS